MPCPTCAFPKHLYLKPFLIFVWAAFDITLLLYFTLVTLTQTPFFVAFNCALIGRLKSNRFCGPTMLNNSVSCTDQLSLFGWKPVLTRSWRFFLTANPLLIWWLFLCCEVHLTTSWFVVSAWRFLFFVSTPGTFMHQVLSLIVHQMLIVIVTNLRLHYCNNYSETMSHAELMDTLLCSSWSFGNRSFRPWCKLVYNKWNL